MNATHTINDPRFESFAGAEFHGLAIVAVRRRVEFAMEKCKLKACSEPGYEGMWEASWHDPALPSHGYCGRGRSYTDAIYAMGLDMIAAYCLAVPG